MSDAADRSTKAVPVIHVVHDFAGRKPACSLMRCALKVGDILFRINRS